MSDPDQKTKDSPGPVDLTMSSIGVVRTPFKEQTGTPIQPRFARATEGLVEIFEPYVEALADVDGFERIWLLFLLDRAKPWQPRVIPYLDTVQRGLFATRAPSRPCPVGLSVVEVVSIDSNRLTVRGIDIIDKTPLLDIKPYIPQFDAFPDSRTGWFGDMSSRSPRADKRFSKEEQKAHKE